MNEEGDEGRRRRSVNEGGGGPVNEGGGRWIRKEAPGTADHQAKLSAHFPSTLNHQEAMLRKDEHETDKTETDYDLPACARRKPRRGAVDEGVFHFALIVTCCEK